MFGYSECKDTGSKVFDKKLYNEQLSGLLLLAVNSLFAALCNIISCSSCFWPHHVGMFCLVNFGLTAPSHELDVAMKT